MPKLSPETWLAAAHAARRAALVLGKKSAFFNIRGRKERAAYFEHEGRMLLAKAIRFDAAMVAALEEKHSG